MMNVWFLAAFLASNMTFSGHAENPPTSEQLEGLVRAVAFAYTKDLNTNTIFNIRQMEVKGLWERLKVEVFDVQYQTQDGDSFNGFVGVYHNGGVTMLAPTIIGGGGLFSGLLNNDDFYYSYGFGFGVFRSHVAKIQIANGGLEVSTSGGFQNEVLFVSTDSGGKVKVVDGEFKPFKFNDWGAAKDVGFVGVTNSSGLQIIDAKGNIVSPTWGPGTNWVIFDKGPAVVK